MMNRFIFLDVIRGLAALSVVLTHVGTAYLDESTWLYYAINFVLDVFNKFAWVNGGLHPGVIVFIVLSGFCIHLPQANKRSLIFSIREFAHRRFFRIYPVFVTGVILGVVVNSILGEGKAVSIENIITNILFLSAFLPLHAPIGNPILHSVIVECVLYCLYPVGLKIVRATSWRFMLFFCLGLYTLNAISLFFLNNHQIWFQRNIWSLLCYWWIGVVSVELCYGKLDTILINKKYCFYLYLAYLFFCLTFSFKGSHLIKSLLFAILVAFILMCLLQGNRMAIVQNRKKFVFITNINTIFTKLGEVSYSLYVAHLPILTIFNFYFFQKISFYPDSFYFLRWLLIISGTIILYYFVEKPSHRYAKAIFRKNYSVTNARF